MTQYADYDYYINKYKGTMPESDFDRMSIIASNKIKANTFGRIDENNIPEEVKYCMCAISDKLLSLGNSEGKTSESVGSWSVQYAESKEGRDLIIQTIKEFLLETYTSDGIPVLYRGC